MLIPRHRDVKDIASIVDADAILRSMRWAAFQTPRARSIGWAIAIGLLTLTLVGWAVALVSAFGWFERSFAIDYGIYVGALDRWRAGDGWYQARQLQGPYPIELGDVLYPPVLMYLLLPFRYLGPWLWTIVPAVILGWVVWRHRPGPWAWAAIVSNASCARSVARMASPAWRAAACPCSNDRSAPTRPLISEPSAQRGPWPET